MKNIAKKIAAIMLVICICFEFIPMFKEVASADGNITYIHFTEPKNFEELIDLKKEDISITASKFKSFDLYRTNLSTLTEDQDDSGVCLLFISVEYDDDDPANLVDAFVLNDVSNVITKIDYTSKNDAIANIDQIEYAVLTDYSSGKLTFARKYYFGKSLDITINPSVGTQAANVYLNSNIDDNNMIMSQIYLLGDSEVPLDNSDAIEANKIYRMEFQYRNVEDCLIYDKVTVNNAKIPYLIDTPCNTFYKIVYGDSKGIDVSYEFSTIVQTSSGSKRYKANDNDTAEKVSGSGKKGSTRTIVPEEGRKVSNVTVTDKKGNPVEVTMNEDGTYSFIQPASDVIIDVDYASREIKMEVGTVGASIDGIGVNEYVTPKVRNNEVMLPVRFIAENLGAKVDWNEKEPNMIYITRGDKKIEIKLGSNVIKVNGEEITLESASFAEGNRTYVPFKLVETALDAVVEFDTTNANEIVIKEI